MEATVYRFDGGRFSRRQGEGIEARGFDRFLRQFDCLLQRLGDLHLRISLARLALPGRAVEPVSLGRAIVDNLQDPCAVAGVMPDGSVVAAFLGPRDNDNVVGDEEMTKRITRKFDRTLRDVQSGASALDGNLTVAHCWSDEIYDVPSFVLDLASVHQARQATGATELKAGGFR